MSALSERFGPVSASSDRMIAYGVQQLRILSRSTDVVRRDVNQALDLAERTGIPVFLHVDSCYGWGADSEKKQEDAPSAKFWQHPEMREWDRFPNGDQLQERVPRPWLHWGPWCSPAPAVAAFGSPTFVTFATSQLDEGVLLPVASRLRKWQRDGREYLFAGINIGWEAHFPNFGDPAMLRSIELAGGVVRAEYPRSARGVEMDRDFVGKQLGYASLHWRGWNEERLRLAAKQEGITRDVKFQQLCYESLHDFMETMAKACCDQGITADRVFTHIVALASVQNATTIRPPIWTAVNPYSTPGFTMDNRGGAKFDLAETVRQVRAANGNHDVHFGVVESYFNLGGRVYFNDTAECLSEIKAMFAAGARVQAFYGGFPLAANRIPKPALVAIEQWLSGNQAIAPEQRKGN
ncbi:hypothetical protein [Novipirellula herctigrandis]